MIRRIKNRLHSTHDDQGGQTLIFIAIVMFALVCFFALVINVGDRVTAKVEMQNAADAAVMSGGIWNARGMNMISILNVGMTECLAFIIFCKAFDKTYLATKVALEANKVTAEACSSIPYIGIICKIWSVCLKAEEKIFLKAAEKINKFMKKNLTKKNKGLWKLMKLLEKMEKGVSLAFPLIAAYEANRVAELNGADPLVDVAGFTYSGLFFPADPAGLPVKKGVFKDLCPPTTKGGPGYKNFLCWDSALGMEIPIPGLDGTIFDGMTKVREIFALLWEMAFLCVIPPPGAMWEGFVELSKMELCAGGTHSSTETTTNCRECNEKNGTPRWKGRRVEMECDPPQGHPAKEIGQWENAGEPPQGSKYPCSSPSISDPPKGSKRPCTATCWEKKNGKCYKYKWVLKGCTYKGDPKDVKKDDTSKEAVPYMLKAGWGKDTKYTAIVSKKTSDKLPIGQYKKGGESFGTSTILGNLTWTVAQAELYNPTKADLFNQDWHVRLKSCKLDDLNIIFFGKKVSNILPSSIKKVLDKGIGQGLVH